MRKKIITKLSIIICLLMIANTNIYSQEHVNDTVSLYEVVVTGSKQYRSAGNVTQKIDIIKTAEIEEIVAGNNNIAEVLAEKPGSSVSVLSRNDANWGTYSGIGPKYSTYMLNGLPLDAFIDPMSLDLMAVERIEIQRGPASVLYPNYLSQDFAGNQSPLAGTVNLILKDNIKQQESVFQTTYGSYNTLNTQAYYQNGNDKLNFFAGANFENSDYTNYGTENSWLNMQKDPQYQKLKLFAGAGFFFGNDKKNKMNVFINRTSHQGDAGRVYRGFNHDYTTVNISQSSEISDVLSFNASVGIRIYNRTWQDSHFNVVDSLVSNNGVRQKIIPVDANVLWKHGKSNLLTIGVDYQNAEYNTFSDPLLGYDLYGNKSRAYQNGIYAQEELHFGNLTIRGGIRYNYIKTTIELISGGNPGEPVTEYNNLLWSTGLKYKITPTISIYANAGSSFSPPGLKSMGGTIKLSDKDIPGMNGQLPNPDLKPESGIGVDLGSNMILTSNLQLSVRGYYMIVDDAIIDIRISEDPSQSQSINAGKTTSTGFEIGVSQQINNNISWFANYTFMNTNIENSKDADQDGANVPFAPEHVANAGITVGTGFGLNIRPALNYNSGYYDSSSKSGRKKFTPGTLINLYVSQLLVKKVSYNIDVFAKAYNITNNKYEMPWQFQDTGFAINCGFRISFK